MWWRKSKRERSIRLALVGSPERGWTGQVGSSLINVGRFSYGIEYAAVHQWDEGAALNVGSFCSIAEGLSVFLGGNHRTDWGTTYPFGHINRQHFGGADIVGHPCSRGDVNIGNDVWIGSNVTLLSGVEIGDGAVVAATATVTRTVGSYEIWGGNPAKLIRKRFPPDVTERLRATRWWDCSVETIRTLAPLLSRTLDPAALDQIEDILRRAK